MVLKSIWLYPVGYGMETKVFGENDAECRLMRCTTRFNAYIYKVDRKKLEKEIVTDNVY